MLEPVEIVIRRTGQPDRVVRYGEGVVRIGRAEDNEIVLSDVGVSRKHAQLRISRNEVVIQDLGSGNGVYQDGKKVETYTVKPGDEVVIDPFVLEFRIRQAREAAKLSPVPAAAPLAPVPGRATARLEVMVGTGMAGASYPIPPRGLSIGRSEDRDVVIPDPASSRHHCSVVVQGDDFILRDMGSANGVFINGVRTRDHVLVEGDIIRIGNTEMRFGRQESDGESTTQVVPAEIMALPPPHKPSRAGPTVIRPQAAAQPSRFGPALVLALLLAIALVGVLGVGGIGTLAGVFYWARASGVAWPPAHKPHWSLTLPPGLPEATTSDLFEAGVGKMQAGDNEGALVDFYRVLVASPGNAPAEKFAFAAGEYLVLQQLEGDFVRSSSARKERESTRDKLIAAARANNADAKDRLDKEFRDDPVVLRAMGWPPSDAAAALSAEAGKAAELQASQDYAQAARLYAEVLAGTADPALANTAEAGLIACRRELARTIAPQWTLAIHADAFGSPEAPALWKAVASAQPDNPSARAHLASESATAQK